MKLCAVCFLLIAVCGLFAVRPAASASNLHRADIEDNEFAEFEEFDEDDDTLTRDFSDSGAGQEAPASEPRKAPPETDGDEATVEDEDDEDEVEFMDDEEFEGFDSGGKPTKAKTDTGDIKISQVPIHLRTNWDSYYLEMLMIAGLLVYFLNFIAGRNKNQRLANSWLAAHRELLEQNFCLVGDDGKTTENENPGLIKESENIYTLWCSGRTCCEGMLVEMRCLKRQDLIHVITQLVRPSQDQIIIKITMNSDDMDNFVFVLSHKKTALKYGKEMTDICSYCPEKKSTDKFGLPASFVMFNELGEVPGNLLDPKILTILNKYEELIDYIHFSDQFSGVKLPDDSQPAKVPEGKKVLIFAFNVPGRGHSSPESMETMKPLLQLVFYCIEKVKRFKLSKEAKSKSEKTRLRFEEVYLKNTHQQRVEAAQQRREDKRKAEKERIMAEEDPEKQRKWEEREHKRELKKRAPKMKQLKVKAL